MRICKDYCVIESQKKIIEAQRQEIELLQRELSEWKFETQCHMDIVVEKCKEVESLQERLMDLSVENEQLGKCQQAAEETNEKLICEYEQLQAQVARCKDALAEIFALLEEHEPSWYLRKHYNMVGDTLSSAPTNYHNPADVEEIEQLQAQVARMREAISYVLYHLKRGGKSWIIDRLEPSLSDTPTDYHNPADVEEIEQLQAQVARYREALKLAESRFKIIEQATEYVKPGTGVWHTVGIALQEIQQFKQSLSSAPTNYHNPADVAEIELLQAQVARYREALKLAESRLLTIEQATEYIKPGTGVWYTVGIALQEIQRFKQSLSTTPTEQAGLCCSCGTRNATISTDDGQYCKACAEDLEQEEVIDLLTYHNPADIEALEKAREALGYFAKSSCSYCGCGNGNHAYDCKVKEALAAIDKIGGREDV